MMNSIQIAEIDYSPKGRKPSGWEKSHRFILARLLCGSCVIKAPGRVKLEQKTNYSIVLAKNNTTQQTIKDFLKSYNIKITPQKFVKVDVNRIFYETMLHEFSAYFIQSSRGAHTAAFVFLYRALEHLFYTSPLLYCANNKDYYGTFNNLKKFFNGKSDQGEFGFFDNFLKSGNFIEKDTLSINLSVKFKSEAGYKTVKEIIQPKNYDDTRHELKVAFQEVPKFILLIRNRFFHQRTGDGQKNIKLKNIGSPDEFFSCLNPTFCNVLSILTLSTFHKE